MSLPILSALVFLPLLGALLIWLGRESAARRLALLSTGGVLALSLSALSQLDPTLPGWQLIERQAWIPGLNVQYLLGIDGISVLFLVTSALLFGGVVLASWNTVRERSRLYYSLLMLLLTATLGIFCALDGILFFLFWELTLLPLYFLVSLWGVGPHRGHAASKYFLVMLAGGVPLLFGFVLLGWQHLELRGAWAFDLPALMTLALPPKIELAAFLLLALGFAVKTPVFPLHTWMPMLASEGPVAISAVVLGLKLGAYGLIRFAVPLAPGAALSLHWLLAGLGVLGLLYGAVAALAQTNLRRMLAYSSLSHVGLVLLGIASFNLQGTQGAVLQLLNFSLISGALLLISAGLHQRLGSNEVRALGGAARSMPLLASFFLFFALASMGLPGTSGFPAEWLILLSALKTHTGAALAALFGMVLGAAYLLSLYRKAFFGPVLREAVAGAADLLPRERWVLGVFAGLVLAVGLYPGPVLDLLRPAAALWVARVHG